MPKSGSKSRDAHLKRIKTCPAHFFFRTTCFLNGIIGCHRDLFVSFFSFCYLFFFRFSALIRVLPLIIILQVPIEMAGMNSVSIQGLLYLLIVSCFSSLVLAQSGCADSWTTVLTQNAIGTQVGAAYDNVNDLVYLIAGTDPTNNEDSKVCQVFNPATRSLQRIADLPFEDRALDCEFYAGKVYCFSGLNSKYYIYNTLTNNWFSGDAPIYNWEACVSLDPYSRKFYIFGGEGGEDSDYETRKTLLIYDIVFDSFSFGPDMPNAILGCDAAYHRGQRKIYIVGGTDDGCTNCVLRFDPATHNYQTLNHLPTPRGKSGFGLIGDNIVVAGGGTDYCNQCTDGITSVTEIYNIQTGLWSPGPAYPLVAREMTSVVRRGTLYVFGGSDGSENFVPDVYALTCSSATCGSNNKSVFCEKNKSSLRSRL